MPKQAIVHSSIEAVEIIDTPIPIPREKEIVIKVSVSGTNPKDWKYPLWRDYPHNSGDDIAGIVYSVGKDVYEFKPGDRVAAFHECGTPNGSFAEFAVAPDWVTFHLPKHVSFEEAATIPLAALTASLSLFLYLGIPPLCLPNIWRQRQAILIYGISSAVGAFGAQLARLSGVGPIIGVAGRSHDLAHSLADYVVDYRKGEDELVASVTEILAAEGLGTKVPYVLDAISGEGSFEATARIINPDGGRVVTTMPWQLFARTKEHFRYPDGVLASVAPVTIVHAREKDFGFTWTRYLSRLLNEGKLKSHPYEVIPGGLAGVLTGLKNLKEGKASGVKYIYRIEDTDPKLLGLVGNPSQLRASPVLATLNAFPEGSRIEEQRD